MLDLSVILKMFCTLLLIVCAVSIGSWLFWLHQRRSLWLDNLQKRCVFITGCDSGFGRALALRLDGKGIPVFAGCFTDEGAKKLKGDSSSKLMTVKVDVTSTESVQSAYNTVSRNIPQDCVLWGVVNNSGLLGINGPAEFYDRDDYRRLMEVNFFGMTDVNRIFLPLLRKSTGRIVNMASIAGVVTYPQLVPYVASKHAVTAYSDVLRMELAPSGIRVGVVEPGGYRTNILEPEVFKANKKAQWAKLPDHIKDEYNEESVEDSSKELIKWQVNKAKTNLDPVVNAYEHGLFAVHPKAHYLPDIMSKAMYLLHFLPRPLYDKMMIRRFAKKKGQD